MACAVLGIMSASGALAYDLSGQVINGTTGNPVTEATIKIVNPSGGMMVENETHTIDDLGHFSYSGLSEDAPIYLIRTEYKGINYTDMVRYQGLDSVTVRLTVYEPTTEWSDIEVNIPQVVVSRSSDSLLVDQFFEIDNRTSPPRTVYGDGAQFEFPLPADKLAIHQTSAISLGVPVPISPVPTDDPARYRIDYPLKPGITRISLQYSLPYGSGSYRLVEKMPYDVDQMAIFTEDPSLGITSDHPSFQRAEDVHGFAAYVLGPIAQGTELALEFSGGRSMPGGQAHVIVLPSQTNDLSLVLLLVTFVIFSGLLALGVGSARQSDVEQQVLLERREELLDQLARLDDLQATGTVSDQIYKLKRAELVHMLAQVYYRTRFEDAAAKTPEPSPPAADNPKGAARV